MIAVHSHALAREPKPGNSYHPLTPNLQIINASHKSTVQLILCPLTPKYYEYTSQRMIFVIFAHANLRERETFSITCEFRSFYQTNCLSCGLQLMWATLMGGGTLFVRFSHDGLMSFTSPCCHANVAQLCSSLNKTRGVALLWRCGACLSRTEGHQAVTEPRCPHHQLLSRNQLRH